MRAPQLFRKRPATVEAMQWDGSIASGAAIKAWAGDACSWEPMFSEPELYVVDGQRAFSAARVAPGDWVVRGEGDDFYPVRADRFEALFEPVAERPGRG